jgi:hypothetical protein
LEVPVFFAEQQLALLKPDPASLLTPFYRMDRSTVDKILSSPDKLSWEEMQAVVKDVPAAVRSVQAVAKFFSGPLTSANGASVLADELDGRAAAMPALGCVVVALASSLRLVSASLDQPAMLQKILNTQHLQRSTRFPFAFQVFLEWALSTKGSRMRVIPHHPPRPTSCQRPESLRKTAVISSAGLPFRSPPRDLA